MGQAIDKVEEVQSRLGEVSALLEADEELAALGALTGLAAQVQYVETLLTVLRDVQTQGTGRGPH